MTTRLISSDSHVNVQHDQVKANLATKYHDAYDAGSHAGHDARCSAATRPRRTCRGSPTCTPRYGRPGYIDPVERLADMDIDGVDIEVLYCEVSAYRYLYLMSEGSQEATRAFNDTLLRVRVGRSPPSGRHRPGADPRHRLRHRGGAAGRRPGLQVAAAAGVPGRGRRARLPRRALRPAVVGDRRDGPAGVQPHRAQHRAQPARPTVTPRRAWRGR